MIEGIHFDFTGKELKDHFLKRAERNRMRAEAFVKELARYKEDEDAPVQTDVEQTYSNKAIGSARDTLKGRVKHYKMRAMFFAVGADHLVPTETYRLSEHDMTSLEIVYEG
jgi:hypothetical protein